MLDLGLIFATVSVLGIGCLLLGLNISAAFPRLSLPALPVGFMSVLIFGYVIHKIGFQEYSWLFAGTWLTLSSVFAVKQFKNSRLALRELSVQVIQILTVSFVFVIGISQQLLALNSKSPVFASFDLSAGDMNSYLEISESLRNRGWSGDVLSYDLGPNDDVFGKLTWIFEHIGSGGYILLSTIGGIFGVQTWQVGTLCLGLIFIALALSGAQFLHQNSNLARTTSFALALVIFSSTAYLLLIGWWALNQLIFTVVLINLLLALKKILSKDSTVAEYLLVGVGFSLAFEVYPSVSAYSLIPILVLVLLVALMRGQSAKFLARLRPSLMLLPLSYSFFGTAGFLKTVFLEQFDHKLELGSVAPGILDFAGLGGFIRAIGLDLDPISGITTGLGVVLVLYKVFTYVRSRRSLAWENSANIAILLGGSVLITYSLFISQTSYQAFKLRMLWIPICLLLFFAIIENNKKLSSRIPSRHYFVTPLIFIAVANSFGYSSFAAAPLKIGQNAEMLAITYEKLEVKNALSMVPGPSLTTDFSNGQGWIPSDRTIVPAILEYPGKMIFSGSRLSGYPYFSGWVVTGAEQNPRPGPSVSTAYSSENYRLVHVCRLVCTSHDSGITAFLAGVPKRENSQTSFADTSFSSSQTSSSLSLKIVGEPLSKVLVRVSEESKSCLSTEAEVMLNSDGFGRHSIERVGNCDSLPKSIFLRYGG